MRNECQMSHKIKCHCHLSAQWSTALSTNSNDNEQCKTDAGFSIATKNFTSPRVHSSNLQRQLMTLLLTKQSYHCTLSCFTHLDFLFSQLYYGCVCQLFNKRDMMMMMSTSTSIDTSVGAYFFGPPCTSTSL